MLDKIQRKQKNTKLQTEGRPSNKERLKYQNYTKHGERCFKCKYQKQHNANKYVMTTHECLH